MDNLTCSFVGCGNKLLAAELCNGHYTQRLRGIALKPLRIKDPVQRFWARVDKSGDCWEWTGPKVSGGYARFNINGAPAWVHRLSYQWEHGEIPDGMVVDHVCHNRICVKPAHLRLASGKQNAEHRTGAQANNKSSGVRGVYRRGSRWLAMVRHNQKLIRVGLFDSIAEAEAAVIAKRVEVFTHNNVDRVASWAAWN